MADVDEIPDDDWDDLPADIFAALEQEALQFTQQAFKLPGQSIQRAFVPPGPSTQQAVKPPGQPSPPYTTVATLPPTALYGSDIDGSRGQQDVTAHTVLEESLVLGAGNHSNAEMMHASKRSLATTHIGPHPSWKQENTRPSSQWQRNPATNRGRGSLEDLRRREQRPAQRQGPQRGWQTRADATADATADDAEQDAASAHAQVVVGLSGGGRGGNECKALELQIQELLREQEQLRQQLDGARADVVAKTGEVAIIRSNQDTRTKDLERQLVAARNRCQDESAKLNAQLNAKLQEAIAEKEHTLTENRTLRQDLSEVAQEVKQFKHKGRDDKFEPGVFNTPKKSRIRPYADGFDEDEVMLLSPARSGGRSRTGTPKSAAKRKKRPLPESPAKSLPLRLVPSQASTDQAQLSAEVAGGRSVSPKLDRKDSRYEFLQSILDHRTSRDRPPTLEEFANYHFPSKPDLSLTSILLQRLHALSANEDRLSYAVKVCELFLGLWSECVDEKYYPPVPSLTNVVFGILALETSSKAPDLTELLVRVTQATADVNGRLRHQQAPVDSLKAEIDVKGCLRLLHLTALGCTEDDVAIQLFWKCMRIEFVLLMLAWHQPLDDVCLMLVLLATSGLPGSLGPGTTACSSHGSGAADDTGDGVESSHQQAERESHLLERLSVILTQTAPAGKSQRVPNEAETGKLRLQVLELMHFISGTAHGGSAMAKHDKVIGSVVKLMNDELDALYDYRPGHELSAKQVNLSTRILYRLVTQFMQSDEISHAHTDRLREKLLSVPGGTHKHLVGLARLAFSEGFVMEAGIEEEVIEYAHQMLEEAVTPEEAEALVAAFSVAVVDAPRGGSVRTDPAAAAAAAVALDSGEPTGEEGEEGEEDDGDTRMEEDG